MDKKQEIKKIEELIIELDTQYENGGECINPQTGDIVSDNEYDNLRKKLQDLYPQSEVLKKVTASQNKHSSLPRIKHNPPMTSIKKCNGTFVEKEKILQKWATDCGTKDFSMSYKHDGIALSINYEDGKLKNAGLRSKSGIDGIDVTEKTKYIKGIPQQLESPLTFTIRGEIETTKTEFIKISKQLGDKAKANPRAHTSGAMILKTAEEMKDRGLSFVAYNILNFENPPYKTEIERASWAESMGFNYVKTIPFSLDYLKAFEEVHRQLDFMVDGVVISVNDLEKQKQLGKHGNSQTGNPKGKIAWKFEDETKEITVNDIIWQTGRTGAITPVLIFDGVELEGTIVSKCTAHNVGIIQKNKIGIGSKIEIIKSGKIIPKIKRVIEPKGEISIPSNCPTCKEETSIIEGNDAYSLVCSNSNCPAQNVQRLYHFLNKIGAKGVAESTINKLIENKLVKEPADFYKLNINDITSIGFKERTATLILARIRLIDSPEQEKDNSVLMTLINKIKGKKIKIPMDIFISALGIEGAGKELGRILAENYESFDTVRKLTIEELNNLDGIGPITASNVHSFFVEKEKEINNLLTFFEITYIIKKQGNLKDKTFCLSGSLPGGKNKWKDMIEENGGIIKNSVSKKLDYLVAGSGSGSKSEKAEKFNVKIINVNELEKMT